MKFQQILLMIISTVLLTACAQLAVPETTPTPTAIPTLTPTPTPAPEEILADGWTAFDNGDLDTAESIATQLLDSPDVETEVTALLGLIELERKQYEPALTALEAAREGGYADREIAPLMFAAYLYLIENNIQQLYQTYNFDTIQTLAQETTQLYARMKTLPPEVLDIPQEVVDLVDREEIFDLYIELSGEADNLYQQGENYLKQGDYPKAKEKFAEALALAPESIALQIILGRISAEQGEYEEAIAQLNQALKLNPDVFDAYTWLADSYTNLNLPQHTRDAIIQLSFISNENAEIVKELLEMAADYDQSLQHNLFNDYGFALSLPANFELLSIEGNQNYGVAFLTAGNKGMGIIWGGSRDEPFVNMEDLETWVGTASEEIVQMGNIDMVGETSVFPYNQEDIFVQQYTINFTESMGSGIGIKAGWKCNQTFFGMNFVSSNLTSSTNFTVDRLYRSLYPLFESLNCDVPVATQIQGNADAWIAGEDTLSLPH